MAKQFTQRKGQSAIEYLTTYGWMLLVIAIVGGAIFTTVQGSADVNSVTGFKGEDVQITNFGVSNSGGLQLEVRAQSEDAVTVKNVTLSTEGSNPVYYQGDNKTIESMETKKLTVSNIESSDSSNEFDVQIKYDTGELTSLTVNGTMTGNFQTK